MFCRERLLGRQWQTVWVRIPPTRKSSFLDLVPWSPPPSIYLIENCNPISSATRASSKLPFVGQRYGVHA